MVSFTFEIQRPVYCTSVTWCFVCLAALSCCNALLHQNTSKMTDPLQSASESSTTLDMTKQPKAKVVSLGSLVDAGDVAVVTLVAGGTRLAAHRAVLAARSPVFAAMFRPGTLEASSIEVAITDLEGPVLRQLVVFLYTGRAPQLPGMALQLLEAAEKYGVSALNYSCEQLVAEKLSVENAAAIAVLANRYSCHNLRKTATDFINDHFEVVTTQGWADAVLNHPDEVLQITRLLGETPADTSTTAITDSTPTHTAAFTATTLMTQTHSDDSQSAVVSTRRTAARHTLPPDATAVSGVHTTAITYSTPTTTTASTAATPATSTSEDSMPTATGAADTLDTIPVSPTTAESTSTPTAATPASPTAPSRPYSGLNQTAATPQIPAADCHSLLLDAAAVSHFRSLPAEERGRKLIQAARDGAVKEMCALLAAGADVGAKDGGGWTPLHSAADFGHVEATQCLLQAGAEVNARDQWQWTPLHWAADRGHTAVVQLLLRASGDPNARDVYGATSLHWAALNDRADVVAVLLQAGANRAVTTNKGETALDLASERNHSQVVQMLQ